LINTCIKSTQPKKDYNDFITADVVDKILKQLSKDFELSLNV